MENDVASRCCRLAAAETTQAKKPAGASRVSAKQLLRFCVEIPGSGRSCSGTKFAGFSWGRAMSLLRMR